MSGLAAPTAARRVLVRRSDNCFQTLTAGSYRKFGVAARLNAATAQLVQTLLLKVDQIYLLVYTIIGESPFYRRILVFTAQLTSTTRANMCIVISYFVKLALTIWSLSGQPTTSRYRQHSKRRWSARHYFCLSCIFRLGLLFKNFTRFKIFLVYYIF